MYAKLYALFSGGSFQGPYILRSLHHIIITHNLWASLRTVYFALRDRFSLYISKSPTFAAYHQLSQHITNSEYHQLFHFHPFPNNILKVKFKPFPSISWHSLNYDFFIVCLFFHANRTMKWLIRRGFNIINRLFYAEITFIFSSRTTCMLIFSAEIGKSTKQRKRI